MRGRKPTPPNLKVLAGTARKCREIPDVPEFDLVAEFPEPPSHLEVDGAQMWDQLGPQLVSAKVLQVVDLFSLEQLCFAWQRFRKKARAGVDITASEDQALKALFSEFGMTPASRRKVTSSGDQKKENRFAKFGQV